MIKFVIKNSNMYSIFTMNSKLTILIAIHRDT